MKTVKTSELTGAALDWAVARALGKRPSLFIFQRDGKLAAEHNYSTDWAQGGPIIERERMNSWFSKYRPGQFPITLDHWFVEKRHFNRYHRAGRSYAEGPTLLIAAMRCYVASKLGDEVEIPEELI